MSGQVKPSVDRELTRLKDFQRATVDHVFHRMYEGDRPSRRFLVADEVGLGKTMVARGLVAKVVDHLWDKGVKRIDVVYVCSNAGIARQNINRLNITELKEATLPSRITLLPKAINDLESRRVNFISLTPQTSLNLRSSLGTAEERALLYWMLPSAWRDDRRTAVQNALQGGAGRDRFRAGVKASAEETRDATLTAAFHAALENDASLRERFDALCADFERARDDPPPDVRTRQRAVVGDLRLKLALSCVQALEPDLIILDEFQRFRHLLDPGRDDNVLARELFRSAGSDARLLLLSATPYKMLTRDGETGGDDHYRDFARTIAFLLDDEAAAAAFQATLERYSAALDRAPTLGTSGLAAAKEDLQLALRKVMVRTERLAADRNGMLVAVTPRRVSLEPNDIDAYLAMGRIAQAVAHGDVVEYWKSSPYLLNFMDDYQFKQAALEELAKADGQRQLRAILSAAPSALLTWGDVEEYRTVDPANARLRALWADVIDTGAWQLLWVPPSLPYYTPRPPFDSSQLAQFTKRLVFSAWHVVPKVVAALLSYEAERRMFQHVARGQEPLNSAAARQKRRGLLRFSRDERDRLTGLPVLAAIYPSSRLAELGDPLELPGRDRQLLFEEALEAVKVRIQSALATLTVDIDPDATELRQHWYWAAPILLDAARDEAATRSWLFRNSLPDIWAGEDKGQPDEAGEEGESRSAWRAHVEHARTALGPGFKLGLPPDDLAEVLATLALGGPGIVALRALSRIAHGGRSLDDPHLRDRAAQIGWAFRAVYNLQEVTALLRSLDDGGSEAAREPAEPSDPVERVPYWQRVLQYGAHSCLQAVLDEYVHVLLEVEGVHHRPLYEAVDSVAACVCRVLRLRTATLKVHELDLEASTIVPQDRRMRTRFAARYGAAEAEDGAGALRQDDVREAFNSPFWPIVLCSTSVGQEGLDFHPYCHAVVHWNLPGNPVDFEQREGRVHRYKGHAIRKNVAARHGKAAIESAECPDPWETAFAHAVRERAGDQTDLHPFWLYPLPGGASIERHVPTLPLSRDVERLQRLRDALALYRMAFGHNRQDDLIAYLQRHMPAEDIAELAEALSIDLTPDTAAKSVTAISPAYRATYLDSRASEEGTVDVQLAPDVASARELLDRFATLSAPRRPEARASRYRELLAAYADLNRSDV